MTDCEDNPEAARPRAGQTLRFGKRQIPLPQNWWLRTSLGVLFVVFGLLGFLPVLGFWMVPVGLAILAVDFPMARRLQRRLVVKVGRWYADLRARLGYAPAEKPLRPDRD